MCKFHLKIHFQKQYSFDLELRIVEHQDVLPRTGKPIQRTLFPSVRDRVLHMGEKIVA